MDPNNTSNGNDFFSADFVNPLLVLYFIAALGPLLFGIFELTGNVLVFLYAIIGVLCIYISHSKGDLYRNIVPILMVFSLCVLYASPEQLGYVFWTYSMGMGMIGISLWATRVVNLEMGFLISIFLMSTVMHVIPAYITDVVEEIDPYYHYKWGIEAYETGKIPVYDWKTYPKIGGLDRSTMPFGNPVGMAFFGVLLDLVGMGFHQSALLLSGLMAGLTVVVSYFLIKELFKNKQGVKYAAMFAVLMMMLSLAWSSKVHATDCEDDSFGGFILVATMLIYVLAVNRDSLIISLVGGGIMYGWFVTLWDGHRLFTMVVAFAITMYSIIGILKKFTVIKYAKHYFSMVIIGNILWRFVFKYPDQLFGSLMPKGIEIASFAIIIGSVAVNYYFYKKGFKLNRETIMPVVMACILLSVVLWDSVLKSFYLTGFVDVGQVSIVFKTIAEQAPFASNIGEYFSKVSNLFGFSAVIALLSIPIMIYYAYRENNFGSLILVSWLAPMAWGLYFKSQYVFLASIPYALTASWFALFVISKKEHLANSAMIVATMLVLFSLLVVSPFGYMISNYNSGYIFYNVASYDRMAWESALQYFKSSTPENAAIVTWWDYGHWFTAVSRRFVLIDNLQRDHSEIQDVARFFMKETDEDKAFDIIKQYNEYYHAQPYIDRFGGVNVDYVVIDWTMIGKSGAMRFIATSDIENNTDGEFDSYATCSFSPQYSDLEGSMKTIDSKFTVVKTLVFPCTYNTDGLGGVIVSVGMNDSVSVEAITQDGMKFPWKTWMESKGGVLFGVKEPNAIIGTVMTYPDKIKNIPPTYTSFIYSNKNFKDLMMSRLYFGETVGGFKSFGVNNVNWSEMKYFKKNMTFSDGFVESWTVNYDGD